MKPTLLVLAAGMGSRYGGLKQMDPMGPNGETMLDYSVYDAIRAGFDRVVFVIRRDFEADFKQQVGSRFAGKIDVDYAFQDLSDLPEGFSIPEGRTKPWGTAHAILAARNVVHAPFAAINADDFYGRDAYAQIAHYFESLETPEALHLCMVGYNLEKTLSDHGTVNRGVCSTENGLLINVEEYTEIGHSSEKGLTGKNLTGNEVAVSPDSSVSMNFWGFTPPIFEHLTEAFVAFLKERGSEMKSECYIPTVVDDLIKAGVAPCPVLETSSPWFGVTYPDDKPNVVASIEKLIEAEDYPQSLVCC
ncbi:nucleotidyltransferase family protein [Rubellicoccus peritrichatus]|uniref:Sugar phosphate nucleotidyltransferase n=1 Tax=Rubellicoccus peritrichatus TaxID=3080537 RepID=A0AAQ3QQX8_9BACT|nr:sugar phosphate nucleotidyltransferase [Puniceicoccus sp. CR14]WOO40718.1 sugar phosphate nucleotidyltransferase [Puniceicoccus sp. CR14]